MENHFIREGEAKNLRDARRVPIQLGPYSVYVKRGNFLKKTKPDAVAVVDGRWRVRILISRERYKELKRYFLANACHRTADVLPNELWNIPYEPYAPVRKQLLSLLRLVNAKRQMAGFKKIPTTALRLRRRIVKAFEAVETSAAA